MRRCDLAACPHRPVMLPGLHQKPPSFPPLPCFRNRLAQATRLRPRRQPQSWSLPPPPTSPRPRWSCYAGCQPWTGAPPRRPRRRARWKPRRRAWQPLRGPWTWLPALRGWGPGSPRRPCRAAGRLPTRVSWLARDACPHPCRCRGCRDRCPASLALAAWSTSPTGWHPPPSSSSCPVRGSSPGPQGTWRVCLLAGGEAPDAASQGLAPLPGVSGEKNIRDPGLAHSFQHPLLPCRPPCVTLAAGDSGIRQPSVAVRCGFAARSTSAAALHLTPDSLELRASGGLGDWLDGLPDLTAPAILSRMARLWPGWGRGMTCGGR